MCVYYIGFKLRFLLFSNLISTRIYYLMKNGYVERSNTTGEVASRCNLFRVGTHQSVVIDDKCYLFIHRRRMDYCGRF